MFAVNALSRKTMISFLALLMFASVSFGQAISLPDKVQAKPGFFVLRPVTKGAVVRWHVPDVYGVSKVPSEIIQDPKILVLLIDSQVKAKSITVFAWTAIDGVPSEAAVCQLYFGDAPPGPDPGPGPEPEPGPLSELAKKFKAAFDGDKETLGKLVSFYKQAEKETADTSIKTVGQFFTVLKTASNTMLPADKCKNLRQVISEHLNANLPKTPTTEFAGVRTQFATVMRSVASALEEIN